MSEREESLERILAEQDEATKEAGRKVRALVKQLTQKATQLGFHPANPRYIEDREISEAHVPVLLVTPPDYDLQGTSQTRSYLALTPSGEVKHFKVHIPYRLDPSKNRAYFEAELSDEEYFHKGPWFARQLQVIIDNWGK